MGSPMDESSEQMSSSSLITGAALGRTPGVQRDSARRGRLDRARWAFVKALDPRGVAASFYVTRYAADVSHLWQSGRKQDAMLSACG